jgi:hypothetical protein
MHAHPFTYGPLLNIKNAKVEIVQLHRDLTSLKHVLTWGPNNLAFSVAVVRHEVPRTHVVPLRPGTAKLALYVALVQTAPFCVQLTVCMHCHTYDSIYGSCMNMLCTAFAHACMW